MLYTLTYIFFIPGTHYKFSYEDITALIQQAQHFIEKALSSPMPGAPVTLSPSITWLTQLSDIWLVNALQKYPITGFNVVSVPQHKYNHIHLQYGN